MFAKIIAFAFLVVATKAGNTILDIAESNPAFSTLVALAAKAGIAPLLADAGDKTVFAPTNEAFGKLSNATAAWITNTHNDQHLLAVLNYHIVGGIQLTKTWQPVNQLQTLDIFEGKPYEVFVKKEQNGWSVNGNAIATSDIVASNGVIQVINGVLFPENVGYPKADIVQTAEATPILSTLVRAVVAAGLAKALSYPNGPFTVFAPTDQAFAAVPAKLLQCLLKNPSALGAVLALHVVPTLAYSEQVANGEVVPTLAGKSLTLEVSSGSLKVNFGPGSSNVIFANVDTSNGVVHVIDRVMFDGTGPCA